MIASICVLWRFGASAATRSLLSDTANGLRSAALSQRVACDIATTVTESGQHGKLEPVAMMGARVGDETWHLVGHFVALSYVSAAVAMLKRPTAAQEEARNEILLAAAFSMPDTVILKVGKAYECP